MDEALAKLTREWLTKALHDLQTARIVASSTDGPLDSAIYHCQQAAEKTVKGWLTANNIAFEPMYDLARLDTDPTRSALIRGTILEQNMWQKGVIGDKNSWFAYIYAADAPAGSTGSASAVAMANAQIAQFTPPPRVHLAVSNSFPADPNCPGQALDAIDVGQRVINDFDWQRGAWQEVDPGLPTEVYPGVDYLAAYWLARASGFLADDAPGQCTQWQ